MADRPIITTDDLWLPGDVLGGALLRLSERPRCVCPPRVHEHGRCACGALQQPSRIDVNRPEVRDRIVRVLMAGEPCPECGGEGRYMENVGDPDYPDCEEVTCGPCNGTGYTRQPHDLPWVTAAELRGEITATVAAALLWASVLRVDAGWAPIRGISTKDHRMGGLMSTDTGWAMRDDAGHLILPLPDGPVRLEAP